MLRKAAPAQTKKPKRADGYALCDALHDGKCTCRLNRTGPCSSLVWPLQNADLDPATAANTERQKMAYNRALNAFVTMFTGRLRS